MKTYLAMMLMIPMLAVAPVASCGGDGSSSLSGAGSAGSSVLDTVLNIKQGALFYGTDAMVYPGEKARLTATVIWTKDFDLNYVKGATIEFSQDKTVIGQAVTDSKGNASLEWTSEKAGLYRFTAKITKVDEEEYKSILELEPTPLVVSVQPKEKKFVVIDLDHTIVDDGFLQVLMSNDVKAMEKSVDVTKRIAKDYEIIYLTHRPDLLSLKSRSWLDEKGYPLSPLLLSDITDIFSSGKFKTRKLGEIRKQYPNTAIGIGDKPSDAQAYVDNGMTAYLIPNYKAKAKSMRKMAKEIRKLDGKGRLNVVHGWAEIEQGIYDGKKFPPEAFAAELESRAKQMDDEKKKKDDDDDDD